MAKKPLATYVGTGFLTFGAMAKRFTSTEIWLEDWFLDMPKDYKLFWYYVLSKCDHAGIFKVNVKVFNNLNDANVEAKRALIYFNSGKERIRQISDSVWFIEDFFVYQYGSVFNLNNRVHSSIADVYKKYDLNLTSIRGLLDLKDRVKDKDKDNNNTLNKVKGESICENFEYVYFTDGTKQKLGDGQKSQITSGYLKAKDIVKGSIY